VCVSEGGRESGAFFNLASLSLSLSLSIYIYIYIYVCARALATSDNLLAFALKREAPSHVSSIIREHSNLHSRILERRPFTASREDKIILRRGVVSTRRVSLKNASAGLYFPFFFFSFSFIFLVLYNTNRHFGRRDNKAALFVYFCNGTCF
jgi:hypothetical protein